MRILGVVHAYNEGDVLPHTLAAMARYCDAMWLLDHGSTDNTESLYTRWRQGPPQLVWFGLSRERVPIKNATGHQTNDLWQVIGDLIRTATAQYDWVVWMDADELLRLPNGQLPRGSDFAQLAANGVQVLRPLLREFWMTDADQGDHPLARQRWYRPEPRGHCPRAWQIGLTPATVPIARHVQDPATLPLQHPWYGTWPPGTRVDNNHWLLDHYPVRSLNQARRKIIHERAWISPSGGRRYAAELRTRNFVKRARGRAADPEWFHEHRDLPFAPVEEVVPCHASC